MLFGAMSGDSVIKDNEEDKGVEPGELGMRVVEHGDCVSIKVIPS